MPGLTLSQVRVGRSLQHGGASREHTFSAEGRQVTKQSMLIASLGIFLLCNAGRAAAAEFTYRGVKFGMTREEVSKLVPLEGRSNKAAGQTSFADNKVFFEFDDKDQLYAIEINYFIPKPVDIMRPALRRALQKKYAVSNPSNAVWDLGDAFVVFEDYYIGNLAYLRTRITHKRLHDEYLDRLGAQFGPKLQD